MKIKIITSIIVLIAVGMVVTATVALFSVGKEEVKKVDDILLAQHELEQIYIDDLNKNSYSFDNPKIILNPYQNSPLTAIIMFKTDEVEKISITVEGKTPMTTIVHTFEESVEHILPVYGLYADYENKVILQMGDNQKDITIKTEPLPDDFVMPINVFANEEFISNDLLFLSISGRGYTAAYDIEGEPRWYLIGNYAWDISRLENGRLLLSSPRSIAPPYYTVGLVEIDLTGKIYNEYVLPGGYHHDYFEMDDGNLLIASNNFQNGTTEDYVVLMDRKTGKILKNWDLNDVLPQTEGKAEMWTEYDWFHNNSVWYDKSTKSIILSGRHQDAVINIDYNSGKLNWIIGDSTNWGDDMKKYFFTPIGKDFEWQWAQHAAMVLPNGDIFILDNGNNRSKIKEEYLEAKENYTRGVIYRINVDNMTIQQIWQYGKERGSDFYSPYISDVDYYKDDHYLVHSGGVSNKDGEPLNIPAGRVEGAMTYSKTVELLNDELIFEFELPSSYYRAEKLSLYSNNVFSFGQGNRIGSLGQTKPTIEDIKLSSVSTKIPAEYDITFEKEVDRLVFKAKLKDGTKVRIILRKGNEQKVYAATASTKAYTAMCIDIFNENVNDDAEVINISRYINDEGLTGKYNIYLKIDDKLYNTRQYVVFNQ